MSDTRARLRTAAALVVLAGALGTACTADLRDPPDLELASPSSADTTIAAALKALTETVISLPAVTGTAVGLCGGAPCLQVFLSAGDSATLSNIPDTVDGRAVHVVVTGALERLDTVR